MTFPNFFVLSQIHFNKAALHTHPAVDGVACVAVPDAHYGDAVCAVVELRDNCSSTRDTAALPPRDNCSTCDTAALAAALIAHARAVLAPFKAPRVVLFRPLPRTATGKVQKHLLKQALKDEGVRGPKR